MTEPARQVTADRGGVAAGRDVNIGLDAEQVAALVARAVAENNQNVPKATIIEIARRVAPGTDDLDQALKDLGNAVDIAARMRRRAGAPSNLDPFVDAVMAELDALNEKGDFETGIAVADRAVADAEARFEREQAAFGETLNIAIDQHLLALDAEGAATRIARRIDLDAPADPFNALRTEQNIWYERGRDRGLRLDLQVAVALAEITLARATTQDQRGAALNDLGTALWILGERSGDTDRLEAAVTAHQAALMERTQDRAPLDWAKTQNNLGLALWTLGERSGDPARLEGAVTAYEAALKELTQDRVPMDWAMAQNNLGIALQNLGAHSGDPARLEAAVAAYEAALTERTQDRVPLDWAMTQNNLGTALAALGDLSGDTARLEAAVTAFEAALAERTRDRVPLDWAETQNNLGTALSTLGARSGDTARLEAAVTAYEAALTEQTQDRVPLDWAMTQTNLATLYRTRFDLTGDPADLDWAQGHLDAAVAVFRDLGADGYLQVAARIQAKIDARRR